MDSRVRAPGMLVTQSLTRSRAAARSITPGKPLGSPRPARRPPWDDTHAGAKGRARPRARAMSAAAPGVLICPVGASRCFAVSFLGSMNDDAQRARRRISETLQRFYPFFQSSHLEAFPVYGPPDACVRGLREVAEAGAELVLLNPVFDAAEQMERLVAEVVPKLS